MLRNWDIKVKFHNCPHRLIEENKGYCDIEDGPKYCSEDGCPIKQPPNKVDPDRCACDETTFDMKLTCQKCGLEAPDKV